jgi:hypothetical protein
MSPTGKGNDSPCIPHCARSGPVSCTLWGVRAASSARSKAVQRAAGISVKHARRVLRVQGGQLTARRRLFVFVSDFVCLRRARGIIPLASPVASPIAPGADRSAVPFRAFMAASPARSKAVQRAVGVSVKYARRVLRVQGGHLPARRRLFVFVSDFVCLRRARGMIPLASPIAPDAVRSAVPFRAFMAASPARSKAVQRAAGVSVKHARRALRVQGGHLPARRRLPPLLRLPDLLPKLYTKNVQQMFITNITY